MYVYKYNLCYLLHIHMWCSAKYMCIYTHRYIHIYIYLALPAVAPCLSTDVAGNAKYMYTYRHTSMYMYIYTYTYIQIYIYIVLPAAALCLASDVTWRARAESSAATTTQSSTERQLMATKMSSSIM